MTTDPRLERYLSSLERVLRPFPVSDRAEIVTEIKSHVLSALERDPTAQMDTVLAALGEPETVANRYLLERGMKPAKPAISPIVKWLVIGFLCSVAMVLLFVGFMVMYFSPIVQIDEKQEKVSLLGGMIKIDGAKGKISIDGEGGSNRDLYEGSAPLAAGQNVNVKFGNGRMEVKNSEDGTFTWSCRVPRVSDTEIGSATTTNENGVATLDLTKFSSARCELGVPAKIQFAVDGSNGRIEFEKPLFAVDAKLANGHVSFEPESNVAYKYEVGSTNGKVDTFTSSDQPDAHMIRIQVINGRIKQDI